MHNPIKVKLNVVVPSLTKLSFTSLIEQPETTVITLVKHIFAVLCLPAELPIQFYQNETCTEKCREVGLEDGGELFVRVERSVYEGFVAGQMEKRKPNKLKKKQEAKEEVKEEVKKERKEEKVEEQQEEKVSVRDEEKEALLKKKKAEMAKNKTTPPPQQQLPPNSQYQQPYQQQPYQQQPYQQQPYQQQPYQQPQTYEPQETPQQTPQQGRAPQVQQSSCCKMI